MVCSPRASEGPGGAHLYLGLPSMSLPSSSWQDKIATQYHYWQTVQGGAFREERVDAERTSQRKLELPDLHTWCSPGGQVTNTRTLLGASC